jgi:hypothetical protein
MFSPAVQLSTSSISAVANSTTVRELALTEGGPPR